MRSMRRSVHVLRLLDADMPTVLGKRPATRAALGAFRTPGRRSSVLEAVQHAYWDQVVGRRGTGTYFCYTEACLSRLMKPYGVPRCPADSNRRALNDAQPRRAAPERGRRRRRTGPGRRDVHDGVPEGRWEQVLEVLGGTAGAGGVQPGRVERQVLLPPALGAFHAGRTKTATSPNQSGVSQSGNGSRRSCPARRFHAGQGSETLDDCHTPTTCRKHASSCWARSGSGLPPSIK